MEESWRLLGISGCTTCHIKPEGMGDPARTARQRSFAAAKQAIAAARSKAGMGRGHLTRARELLAAESLLPVHMEQDNPFFQIPHADFACFPMDRLHGVYVDPVRLLACAHQSCTAA